MRNNLALALFLSLILPPCQWVCAWITPTTDDRDIVFPFRADRVGHVVSPDVTSHSYRGDATRRPKRDLYSGAAEEEEEGELEEDLTQPDLFILLKHDHEDLFLQLTPNRHLLTPYSFIEWVLKDGRRVLKGVDFDCLYIGRVNATANSLVALSNCGGLTGYIQTNNDSFFIEPLEPKPKPRKGEPGAGAGAGAPQAHVIYRVKSVIKDLNLSLKEDQDFDGSKADEGERSKDEHVLLEEDIIIRHKRHLGAHGHSLQGKSALHRKARGTAEEEEEEEEDDVGERDRKRSTKTKRKCKTKMTAIGTADGGVDDGGGDADGEDDGGKEDVECATRRRTKEEREKRKREREKKRKLREEKRRKREERRKQKKRKRMEKKKKREKEKQKNKKDEEKNRQEEARRTGKTDVEDSKTTGLRKNPFPAGSPNDPFQGEDWDGYSPDLFWEAEVAAGQSGLTEVEMGPPLNETDPPKWLELAVAVDYSVIQFHGKDEVEKYVLTLFNIVGAIYEDPSLEANLRLVLLRIIFYEDETHSQVKKGLAKKSLEAVNRWAERLHHVSPSHLQQDMAVWLTRVHLGGPSGYAPVSGVCESARSCTLNRDEGLTSAFIIAHEMGHVLGLSHDGDNPAGNTCEEEGYRGSVMAPLVAATFNRFHWSRCSKSEYHQKKGSWLCLQNEPRGDNFTTVSSSIKYRYSLDDQCRMEFGEGYALCKSFGMTDPCTHLWCSNATAATPHLCKTKKGPPLEGTVCGLNKWCRRGFCEEMTARRESESPVRHNPQHGGWSSWSEWGHCSLTCGGGVAFRTRSCDNPMPEWGGKDCEGKREEWRTCGNDPCPHPSDLRAEQCAALPRIVKLTRRRSALNWRPYEPKSRRKKCRISCHSIETKEVHIAREFLVDGTPCSYENRHDFCVQGKCIRRGCDGLLGSRVQEDECGVCKGNGLTCSPHVQIYQGTPAIGYNPVVHLPAGAWSIRIEEKGPSRNFLALKDNMTDYLLNQRHTQGPAKMFIAEGTRFRYTTHEGKDVLSAKGPLLRAVTVLVHGTDAREATTISIRYQTEEKQEYFQWELGPFTSCSKTCGGGSSRQTLVCRDRRSDLEVAHDRCRHLRAPQPAVRPCNEFGCEVRWVTSPWEHCTATCGPGGVQMRQVDCVSLALLPKGITLGGSGSPSGEDGQGEERYAGALRLEDVEAAWWSAEEEEEEGDLETVLEMDYEEEFRPDWLKDEDEEYEPEIGANGEEQEEEEEEEEEEVEVEEEEDWDYEAATKPRYRSRFRPRVPALPRRHQPPGPRPPVGRHPGTRHQGSKHGGRNYPRRPQSHPRHPPPHPPYRGKPRPPEGPHRRPLPPLPPRRTPPPRKGLPRRLFANWTIAMVDPLRCSSHPMPDNSRPCNRHPCAGEWTPVGWTKCSVTCGSGIEEQLFECRPGSNEVLYDCGPRPHKRRTCARPECPPETCTGDRSDFCQLPVLHRYCHIPKYRLMCCRTCENVVTLR